MNTPDSTPQKPRSITKNHYLCASEARRILVRLLNEGKTLDNAWVKFQSEFLAGLPIEILRHLEEIHPIEAVK